MYTHIHTHIYIYIVYSHRLQEISKFYNRFIFQVFHIHTLVFPPNEKAFVKLETILSLWIRELALLFDNSLIYTTKQFLAFSI